MAKRVKKGKKSAAAKAKADKGKQAMQQQPVSVAPGITTQEVGQLSTRDSREPASHFCMEDEPMPEFYLKRKIYPCPKCLRKQRPDGSQAVICASSGNDVAALRCVECGYSWQLPVKQL